MKNELTAKRLQLALNNANMIPQELSDKSKVSKASISQYINGSHAPSNISSGKMASVLNVNPVWLMGYDVPMNLQNNSTENKIETVPIESGCKIPVLGRVCAGNGSEAIEEKIDEIEISPKMAQKGEHFGLVIKGDSMTPLLSDGDIVIVNKDADIESGDLVVAMINGSDAMCKRLHRYAEGGFALIPENPTYEAKRYSPDDAESIPVKIIGKVVESRRKY